MGSYPNSMLNLTPPSPARLRFNGAAKKYDGDSQDRPPSIQEKLVGECKGHVKPITCVRFHPSANVVLTASKDGTCRYRTPAAAACS